MDPADPADHRLDLVVAADAQVEDQVDQVDQVDGLADASCGVASSVRFVSKKSLISTTKKSIRFDGSFQSGRKLNLVAVQGFAPNISVPSEAPSNVPGRLH